MGIKPCICKHECEKIVYNQIVYLNSKSRFLLSNRSD